jgi:hypothetical protein
MSACGDDISFLGVEFCFGYAKNINVGFRHQRAHVSEFAAQGTKLEAAHIYKEHPGGVGGLLVHIFSPMKSSREVVRCGSGR